MLKKRLFSALLVFALVTVATAILLNFKSKKDYEVVVRYAKPEKAQPKPDKVLKVEQTEENQDQQEPLPQTEQKEEIGDDTPQPLEVVEFPLELNSATLQELMMIPKVGEVTATRIIQYREKLGGFSNLEQLMQIKGIAENTYNEISAYLYLKGDDWDTK